MRILTLILFSISLLLVSGTKTYTPAGGYISVYHLRANAVSLTSGVITGVDSIVLKKGTWDVNGIINFEITSANIDSTQYGFCIIKGTFSCDTLYLNQPYDINNITTIYKTVLPSIRYVVTADSLKVYCNTVAGFAGGTVKAYPHITAKKVFIQ